MITQQLIALIQSQFALPLHSIHGIAHWERVRTTGLRLARQTGADPAVVELFSYLHDSKRLHDGRDRGHGKRAAEFARTLHGTLFHLSDENMALLALACEHHTAGRTEADITVQTGWEADRLDLGRVGITPDPRFLCTPAARDPAMIAWAFARSVGEK